MYDVNAAEGQAFRGRRHWHDFHCQLHGAPLWCAICNARVHWPPPVPRAHLRGIQCAVDCIATFAAELLLSVILMALCVPLHSDSCVSGACIGT